MLFRMKLRSFFKLINKNAIKEVYSYIGLSNPVFISLILESISYCVFLQYSTSEMKMGIVKNVMNKLLFLMI
jgi:hypothetical protein